MDPIKSLKVISRLIPKTVRVNSLVEHAQSRSTSVCRANWLLKLILLYDIKPNLSPEPSRDMEIRRNAKWKQTVASLFQNVLKQLDESQTPTTSLADFSKFVQNISYLTALIAWQSGEGILRGGDLPSSILDLLSRHNCERAGKVLCHYFALAIATSLLDDIAASPSLMRRLFDSAVSLQLAVSTKAPPDCEAVDDFLRVVIDLCVDKNPLPLTLTLATKEVDATVSSFSANKTVSSLFAAPSSQSLLRSCVHYCEDLDTELYGAPDVKLYYSKGRGILSNPLGLGHIFSWAVHRRPNDFLDLYFLVSILRHLHADAMARRPGEAHPLMANILSATMQCISSATETSVTKLRVLLNDLGHCGIIAQDELAFSLALLGPGPLALLDRSSGAHSPFNSILTELNAAVHAQPPQSPLIVQEIVRAIHQYMDIDIPPGPRRSRQQWPLEDEAVRREVWRETATCAWIDLMGTTGFKRDWLRRQNAAQTIVSLSRHLGGAMREVVVMNVFNSFVQTDDFASLQRAVEMLHIFELLGCHRYVAECIAKFCEQGGEFDFPAHVAMELCKVFATTLRATDSMAHCLNLLAPQLQTKTHISPALADFVAILTTKERALMSVTAKLDEIVGELTRAEDFALARNVADSLVVILKQREWGAKDLVNTLTTRLVQHLLDKHLPAQSILLAVFAVVLRICGEDSNANAAGWLISTMSTSMASAVSRTKMAVDVALFSLLKRVLSHSSVEQAEIFGISMPPPSRMAIHEVIIAFVLALIVRGAASWQNLLTISVRPLFQTAHSLSPASHSHIIPRIAIANVVLSGAAPWLSPVLGPLEALVVLRKAFISPAFLVIPDLSLLASESHIALEELQPLLASPSFRDIAMSRPRSFANDCVKYFKSVCGISSIRPMFASSPMPPLLQTLLAMSVANGSFVALSLRLSLEILAESSEAPNPVSNIPSLPDPFRSFLEPYALAREASAPPPPQFSLRQQSRKRPRRRGAALRCIFEAASD